MDKIQNIGASSVAFKAETTSAQNPQSDNKEKNIKDGNKKSMDTLKWAGIIGASALAIGGAVYAIKRGQLNKVIKDAPKLEIIKEGAEKGTKKIGDKVLTFDKGVASLGGEKFSGAFSHNGATLIYKDGVLQQSVKQGEKGFNKIYKDGKVVKSTVDGVKSKFSYDDDGKLSQMVKNGEKTTFEYSDGKLAKVNDETVAERFNRLTKELVDSSKKVEINDDVMKIGDQVLTYNDKGMALLDGKEFTGVLTKNNETLVYKNGELKRQITQGENGFVNKFFKNGNEIKKAENVVGTTTKATAEATETAAEAAKNAQAAAPATPEAPKPAEAVAE